MKVNFFLLIFISILFSCQNENRRIDSFNKKLPEKDKKVLSELVSLYESILNENYQTVDNPIQQSLKDILNDNTKFWKYDAKHLCKVLQNFENSTLEFKSVRTKYDTVYAGISFESNNPNDSMVISITQEKDTNEHIGVLYGDNSLNAQVEKAKQEGYWKLLNKSSFVNALKHEDNPADINEYIKVKEHFGKRNYRNMAEFMIRDSTINFGDYFIKRIVVFEIISEHLIKERGC